MRANPASRQELRTIARKRITADAVVSTIKLQVLRHCKETHGSWDLPAIINKYNNQ